MSDARVEAIEAVAQALHEQTRPEQDDKRPWPARRRRAAVAVEALLAPRKITCPTCHGKRFVCADDDTDVWLRCADCVDGTQTLPSLCVLRDECEGRGGRVHE